MKEIIISKDVWYNIKINDTKDNQNDIEVILFFEYSLPSFYHGIVNLYYILYNYYITKERRKIIIPKINKNNFYYQFLNIFIDEKNILLLKLNEKYYFKDIIRYTEVKNTFGGKDFSKITPSDFKELIFVNKILKYKISRITFKVKKYDKIFIYRTMKSCVLENNRIFHNYNLVIDLIKKRFPDILIFEPENYTLKEQIYLIMNCNLFINDWGSSLANNLWMKKRTNCICLIHPWMAYFGENQKNSCYVYTCDFLNINFNCCYSSTFHKNKLISNKFIAREKTKKKWDGDLDENYKYMIDLNRLNNLLNTI